MSKNVSLLGLCAFVALGSTVFAGPSGPYSFDFGLPGKPLWDISGTYTLSPTVGGSASVVFPVTIAQDSQGTLTGSGSVAVEIDGVATTGTYSLKGKVTNSGGVARINATVKVSGSGLVQGLQTTYSLSANYKLEIDPISRTVIGSASGSAKASGIGSGPVAESVSAALPSTMSGGWKLQMNLVPTGTKLGGTSSVVLGNGRTLNLGVKGSYSSKNGKSAISLSGLGAAKGTTLKVAGNGDKLTPVTVTGKILGQAVQ
jgi:hypothetical protein